MEVVFGRARNVEGNRKLLLQEIEIGAIHVGVTASGSEIKKCEANHALFPIQNGPLRAKLLRICNI